MKKIFPVFLLIFLFGCEKDYNNVVDVQVNDLQVSSVISINTFNFNPSDSLITVSVKFQSINGLSSVSFNIYKPGYSKINSSPVELFDNGNIAANGDSSNGDNQYSNKFPMSRYYENGTYTIRYFANLSDGTAKNIAEQNFTYNNNQNNVAPVISNLLMADTVSLNQSFTFSVSVIDSNGLSDIAQVYYELFKPDGTQITNSQGFSKFPLVDNGDTANAGDVTSGDGIFTNKLTFPSSQPIGNWNFKFHAEDKGGKLSNEITKTLVVK